MIDATWRHQQHYGYELAIPKHSTTKLSVILYIVDRKIENREIEEISHDTHLFISILIYRSHCRMLVARCLKYLRFKKFHIWPLDVSRSLYILFLFYDGG